MWWCKWLKIHRKFYFQSITLQQTKVKAKKLYSVTQYQIMKHKFKVILLKALTYLIISKMAQIKQKYKMQIKIKIKKRIKPNLNHKSNCSSQNKRSRKIPILKTNLRIWKITKQVKFSKAVQIQIKYRKLINRSVKVH